MGLRFLDLSCVDCCLKGSIYAPDKTCPLEMQLELNQSKGSILSTCSNKRGNMAS